MIFCLKYRQMKLRKLSILWIASLFNRKLICNSLLNKGPYEGCKLTAGK
ncbi:hypothetical protein GCWU000282_01708 [Catonella morbi ATCC 51271]|uniref:Uncharacterized protein n=1 Tax=Catonella morbi ATCC 51271 TaxID=592026 RepID=V2Y1J2_9FIRM|nr:hypothetical protein GCWU000282_01708 [Catonella morbi ATCC 51271]